MELVIDSDASYLSEIRARSRAAGHYYLSSAPQNPANAPDPPLNGAIHTLSQITTTVVSSAAEAELGSTFLNGKDVAMLRTTLHDMGHPQPAIPIKTDNMYAVGIANDNLRLRRSKAMYLCHSQTTWCTSSSFSSTSALSTHPLQPTSAASL
jgi:hypothetical protein